MSMVDSPFLAKMYSSYQDQNNFYLLIELINGRNLWTSKRGYKQKFKEKEIKFITVCLLSGLKALHDKNILHRDIKAGNIIID